MDSFSQPTLRKKKRLKNVANSIRAFMRSLTQVVMSHVVDRVRGKKRQGLGRRNDVLTWLQSGHLARWSADISNNSNIFPKANILEARGETAEEIIQ